MEFQTDHLLYGGLREKVKMETKRRERLSKLLSLILRHKPDRFSIKLDEKGYAFIDDVVEGGKAKFDDLERNEIMEIATGSEKRRFEIEGEKIRARYGHSFSIDLGLAPPTPPEFLYYASLPAQAHQIISDGLKPSGRQYVHLSLSEETATQVARSQTETPVVLCIKAQDASEAGIIFYDRSPVFLTTEVPTEFINVLKEAPPLPPTYGRRKRKALSRR